MLGYYGIGQPIMGCWVIVGCSGLLWNGVGYYGIVRIIIGFCSIKECGRVM